MSKTDDYGSWLVLFEGRRKELGKIMAELERLAYLPLVRQTVQTRLKINDLLCKLAFFVKTDNDVLEILAKRDYDRGKQLTDLISIVTSLVDDLRKVKGLDRQLEDVTKRLALVEETSSKYLDTYESLKNVIDNIRKWEKEKERHNKDTGYIG